MTARATCIVVAVAACAIATRAHASPGVRAVVETPSSAFTGAPGTASTSQSLTAPETPAVSPHLYLNRCRGGCTITGGNTNDARAHKTSIPPAGEYRVGEFATAAGLTGAAADADWAAIVQCVKEVYSPFAITVSDVPPDGVAYNEAVIAGQPGDIARPFDNLGVAPIAVDCSPQINVLSFTFANHHAGTGDSRLRDICWTAAQESAHAYGLDHQYAFTDGTSACRDVMTYRDDCGGQRFFRDQRARCGENATRACRCGNTQNSHRSLLGVFGAGTPVTTPPVVSITAPAGGSIEAGTVVHASAGAQRGVAKVELFLNGSRWNVVPGAAFGLTGQGDPVNHRNDYALSIPSDVPDGKIQIVVVASDDLGIATTSAPVEVVKGVLCTSASQCAAEQNCDDGRCSWEPPSGELGDECSYDQACKSWDCEPTGDGKRCVSDCEPDEPTSCPDGFTCSDLGGGKGRCLSLDAGGCCSAAPSSGQALVSAAFCLLVLVSVLRPRRQPLR